VTCRRFELYRHRDVSGVSGTGVVAEGVEFSDGAVALRWLGRYPSTVAWAGIEPAMATHGHDGMTELRWLDGDPVQQGPPRETKGGYPAGAKPIRELVPPPTRLTSRAAPEGMERLWDPADGGPLPPVPESAYPPGAAPLEVPPLSRRRRRRSPWRPFRRSAGS
jgi:hypothetical protein